MIVPNPASIGRGLQTGVLAILFMLSASLAGAAEAVSSAEVDEARLEQLRAEDRRTAADLAERLALIPGLDDVEVQVNGGLVRLRGQVAGDRQRLLAETIAGSLPGVIHVDNVLVIDADVVVRMAPWVELARTKSWQLLNALPLFAAAATIVAAAWFAGGWLGRRRWLFGRAGRQPFLVGLLRQAVRLAVLLVGLLIALDLLNATALLGALIGTAGVVGIAFGFAFRDVAENYIAGILLSLRQPFAPNDHVVIDGHEGRVASLNSRATVLVTLDGNHLRLPNALVFKGVTLNYTRNPVRRFSFNLGVGNEVDLEQAQQIALDTLGAMPDVLADPPPVAVVADAGDSSMNMRFSAWMDQRRSSFSKLRSEAVRLVKAAFDQAGIDMPDPGYRVAVRRNRDEPASRAPLSAQGDVSPEDHVERVVQAERADRDAPDLLDPTAPRE